MNVQLIDAKTSQQLWAERFEKPVADLFEMQDEIVSRLARTLGVQLIVAEARRAGRSLHPDATELNFQGLACLYKGVAPEHLTRRAIFSNVPWQSIFEMSKRWSGWQQLNLTLGASSCVEDRAACLLAAETNAIKALSLDPDHAKAHKILGGVHIFHKSRRSRDC